MHSPLLQISFWTKIYFTKILKRVGLFFLPFGRAECRFTGRGSLKFTVTFGGGGGGYQALRFGLVVPDVFADWFLPVPAGADRMC